MHLGSQHSTMNVRNGSAIHIEEKKITDRIDINGKHFNKIDGALGKNRLGKFST